MDAMDRSLPMGVPSAPGVPRYNRTATGERAAMPVDDTVTAMVEPLLKASEVDPSPPSTSRDTTLPL